MEGDREKEGERGAETQRWSGCVVSVQLVLAGMEAYRRQADSLQAGDQESLQGEDQAGYWV